MNPVWKWLLIIVEQITLVCYNIPDFIYILESGYLLVNDIGQYKAVMKNRQDSFAEG